MTRDIISLYNEVMETKHLLCSLPELKRIEFFEKNTDKNIKDLERLLKKTQRSNAASYRKTI